MATILVVDDRVADRLFLVTLLGYGGHRILEAGDGAAALSLMRAHAPDLVVTDLLLPVMDGFELMRQLRADPASVSTPVIVYSATYRDSEARGLSPDMRRLLLPYQTDRTRSNFAHGGQRPRRRRAIGPDLRRF